MVKTICEVSQIELETKIDPQPIIAHTLLNVLLTPQYVNHSSALIVQNAQSKHPTGSDSVLKTLPSPPMVVLLP